MRTLLVSLLILQLFAFNLSVDLDKYYKDFMSSNGYPLEENSVTTTDGYILSVWHLKPKAPNGKVVFMQHGLADTAWTFFQAGSKSLPFLLLKEGFDVWLGNIRGNVFSSKHVSKDPKDSKSGFGEYSIDDFVAYDLPAMINLVKSRVGAKKMSYIGHSQGTTMFFMLSMHNPTLLETTFDHFCALGTVPNIAHTDFAPIELLDKIYGILKALNIFNTLTLTNTQRNALASFCKLTPGICGKFFDAGASIKPSNDKEKTAKAYNLNNLKKWKVKALIARTDDDTFSSYQDVTDFYYAVENKSLIKILDLKNYGHIDVLAADSAYNDVFLPILNFIKY